MGIARVFDDALVRASAGVHTGWKRVRMQDDGDARMATGDMISRAPAGDGDAFRELGLADVGVRAFRSPQRHRRLAS